MRLSPFDVLTASDLFIGPDWGRLASLNCDKTVLGFQKMNLGEPVMKGLMQHWPLLVHCVLDHAARWHGEREVISCTFEGPMHGETYRDLDRRFRALASAAQAKLGIKQGDIIATMAWNGYRHMEIWCGVMSLGAIVHTLNPRLFAEQLIYIVKHAKINGYSPI